MLQSARDAADLLEQATQGDRAALSELIRQSDSKLRARFRNEIPKRWSASLSLDDLLQETYTDAFLDIAQLIGRTEGAFVAWLAAIATNTLRGAITSLEAEKRGGGRIPLTADQQEDSFLGLYEWLGCTTTTPSRPAARAEAKAAIEAAIAQLPRDHQAVVRMFDIEGHPAHDVAQVMRRSPGAVFMLRARAHRALARLLGAPIRRMSDLA